MIVRANQAAREALNTLELTISDSGYAQLDQQWYSDGVCSPYSRLYLVESGSGELRCGGQTVWMQPGYAYLLPAWLKCSYRCHESLSKLYFHINLPKPDGYDLFQGYPSIVTIPLEKETLEYCLKLYLGDRLCDMAQLKQVLYTLTCRIMHKCGLALQPMTTYSEQVRNTIQLIRQSLSAQLSVDELAARQFVSRSFLADAFRREVGVPLGRYVDNQLMAKAQWQLLRTELSVGEISAQLGYGDRFYFSRRFKQLCGETPLEYRRKGRAADHWAAASSFSDKP